MSHVNGILENYGPYGMYSRPKDINEPFIPKKCPSKVSSISCPCTPCAAQNSYSINSNSDPLRLKGGGPAGKDEFPAPMAACKELMEDFDRVLEAYKRALGPCGHATCPFSRNVMDEFCKKTCAHASKNDDPCPGLKAVEELLTCTLPEQTDEERVAACGMPSCPYTRATIGMPVEEEFKRTQVKPACGDANCPYTRKKLGFDVDEVEVDVTNLPKTCGFPKCPYAPEPDLPPIHWDCPDPLPKGLCKNPECPYLPKELKCLKRPKSPCGSPLCPYKKPPPCETPGCPFSEPKPCPYPPTCPGDAECPYQNKDPKCPFAPACPHPNSCENIKPCPFSPPGPPLPCPFVNPCIGPINPVDGSCASPTCPLAPPCPPPSCYANPCPLGDACPLNPTVFPCMMPPCPFAPPCPPPPICPFASPCPPPPTCPYAPPCPPPPTCPSAMPKLCTENPCPLDFPPRQPCPAMQQPKSMGIDPCPGEKVCGYLKSHPTICSPDECPGMPSGALSKDSKAIGTGDKAASSKDEKGKEVKKAAAVDAMPYDEEIASCSSRTCFMKGTGDLKCDDCTIDIPPPPKKKTSLPDKTSQSTPALSSEGKKKTKTPTTVSENQISSKKQEMQQKQEKKKRSKFVYGIGDDYPGVKIGHRDCVRPGYLVPARMGWLWNIFIPCLRLRVRLYYSF